MMSDNHLLSITPFVEQSFGEVAYVIHPRGERAVWIIDPSFPPTCDQLIEHVREVGLIVEAIVLTHGHADHIAGLDRVHAAFSDAVVLISREDQIMLSDASANLSEPFGTPIRMSTAASGDLAPGGTLTLGSTEWQILDTSGHSPGGRSLYCAAGGVVVVGDALFAGSIGRTDFPGSDQAGLVANIRQHLFALPDETAVLPGHGPATSVGIERKSNPFLAEV